MELTFGVITYVVMMIAVAILASFAVFCANDEDTFFSFEKRWIRVTSKLIALFIIPCIFTANINDEIYWLSVLYNILSTFLGILGFAASFALLQYSILKLSRFIRWIFE